MDVYRSTPYPHYIKLTDGVLNMEILCDTKTDGGGWIVIQVFEKNFVLKLFLQLYYQTQKPYSVLPYTF